PNNTMIGGKGNDTYVVDDFSDIVTELAGQGTDTIETSVSGGSIAANVENMTYTGSAAWMGIGGNELNNVITGGNNGNEIFGGFGNDTLIGGHGVDDLHGENDNDTLFGGADNDTLNGDDGNDILDGGLGDDIMNGGQGNDFYKVDSLGDTIMAVGSTDTAEITVNATLATPYTASSVEFVKFTGTGSFFYLAGSGNLTITGGAGNDTLAGGLWRR